MNRFSDGAPTVLRPSAFSFPVPSRYWPDDGADTGPILMQARCEIARRDTPSSLYHKKLVPVGIHLMLAAVAAVAAGCAPRLAQSFAIVAAEVNR